jgi:arylsulfatase A-like enzyme
MIAIDDLRPELNCYGRSHVVSPHIDALAAGGVRFAKAHCQFPVCGASRASFMTGLRPQTQRFTHYASYAHRDAPGIVTLPEHFRRHGYRTLSRGKVFHNREDSPAAWCEPAWRPADEFPGYRDPDNAAYFREAFAKFGEGVGYARGPAYERFQGPDSSCPDYQTTDYAIYDLEHLARSGERFFEAVGYVRPHLPFNAPESCWALYDGKDLPDAPPQEQPTDVPPEALHQFGELRLNYTDIPATGPLDRKLAATLRRGYWAATSFLDAQIGQLLAAVDRLGLRDDTIVVFCVDHGWNLGEHGLWCKHCVYETSLHVPLIFRVPGLKPGVHEYPVESLNLYPTLCDLCEIPRPEHALEGVSMQTSLRSPDIPVQERTFSRHMNSETVYENGLRYSEWRDEQTWQVTARTLFDQTVDPGEERNLAN